MKRVLAFDFGASSGRAIRAEYADGRLRYEEIHRFENIPQVRGGHIHHDVDAILSEIRGAIEKAGELDSLAFDTWGVDYGLLDGAGKLVEQPFHYRDSRTEGVLTQAAQRMPPEELYGHTGNQIMGINTLFQLLRDSNREIAERLLFMPDLFSYLLCGEMVCEKTIASTSQMLDPATGDWSGAVLDAFGIDGSLLPPLVESGSRVGQYRGIQVLASAGHDTQSAVAAVPNLDEHTAFLSCGTWSLLGCELDRPILSGESCRLGLSNELGANGRINYLKNITGLFLVQELRKECREKRYSYGQLEQLAAESAPFRCLVNPDDPALFSHGSTLEKLRAFCRRTGQPQPETVGEAVRCIYESLALSYRAALEQIESVTGKTFVRLAVIGGGAQAELLCRMSAECTGREVTAGPVEATALGNILLQLIALGEIPDVEAGRRLIAQSESIRTFCPGGDRAGWNQAYERFKKLVIDN